MTENRLEFDRKNLTSTNLNLFSAEAATAAIAAATAAIAAATAAIAAAYTKQEWVTYFFLVLIDLKISICDLKIAIFAQLMLLSNCSIG